MEENVRIKSECICGSTHFMQEDGKTFCLECQTELESAKEIVYDKDDFGPEDGADQTQRSRVLTTTVKKQNVTSNELPTSWECYNQLLCNLVDEIEEIEDSICSNARRDFKLTVLQMWAAYLRHHQKAFFSKESADYPRFNAAYKVVDAEIIYKVKRPPQKRYDKVKPKTTENSRTQKMKRRMIQKKANQLELRKQNLSVPSAVNKPNIPFNFTPQARELLKTKMSEEHIKEHEQNPTLTCHKTTRRECTNPIADINRTILYSLLYMALNHVESEIQLGDFLRFIREGHVTSQNISPVSNDVRYNAHFKTRIGHTILNQRQGLVNMTEQLAKEIGFKFKEPDLSVLYKRYLKELCLPPEIGNIIDVIIHAFPPKMKDTNRSQVQVSNYEARAMAFIVFVLKLMFGLDDKREYSISTSARELNKNVTTLNANQHEVKQKQLFIWCDWVEYIEMRNNILLQLHCPTAMKTYSHSDGITDLYLEYLTKINEKNSEVRSTFKTQALFQRVKNEFEKIYKIEPKLNDSLAFYASLTPKLSYMEEVRCCDQSNIFIPKFMDASHDEHDIETFLNPSKLQSFFRQHQIKLVINKLSCSENVHEFKELPCFEMKRFQKYKMESQSLRNFHFDITSEQWSNDLNRKQENKLKKTQGTDIVKECLNAIKEHNLATKRKRRASSRDLHQNTSLLSGERSTDEVLLNRSVESDHISDSASTDDENDVFAESTKDTLSLNTSDFDYWMLFLSPYTVREAFVEFRNKLPKSFIWLLKQGADLLENRESDLYNELMFIEHHFSKKVEPFNEILNSVRKRNFQHTNITKLLNGKY